MMIRSAILTLSASALALSVAACADDAADTEDASGYAAGDRTLTDDAYNSAERRAEEDGGIEDGAREDGADETLDEGMRFRSGQEEPEGGLGQTPPVNLAQDLAAGPTGMASGAVAGLSGDVDAYVRNAALGNQYEIEAGRIAMERGQSEEVRAIGQRIVEDHEQLQQGLRDALAAAGLDMTLPEQLEGRRQGLVDNLNAASDDSFDAAFLHQQEAAHLEAVALHEGFEASGDQPELTEFAGMAGNVVQGHLDMVTQNLGAAVDGN